MQCIVQMDFYIVGTVKKHLKMYGNIGLREKIWFTYIITQCIVQTVIYAVGALKETHKMYDNV